jgi:molybdopterin converting factor small subunit
MTSVTVSIRFVGPLKQIAGSREVSILLPAETSLAELGDYLLKELGQKSSPLIDPATGHLRRDIRVLHNGRFVQDEDGPTLELENADTLSLMFPISGGSAFLT